MSTTTRVLGFGIVSGLIWSVFPGGLTELFSSAGETTTVLVSSVLTGVLVSFALRAALARLGGWCSVALGLLSLPVGAFIFGVLISVAQFLTGKFIGVGYHFGERNPLMVGLEYGVFSAVSLFAVALFPLAILSTFLLRAVIRSGTGNQHAC